MCTPVSMYMCIRMYIYVAILNIYQFSSHATFLYTLFIFLYPSTFTGITIINSPYKYKYGHNVNSGLTGTLPYFFIQK